jgi:hypothetical protein
LELDKSENPIVKINVTSKNSSFDVKLIEEVEGSQIIDVMSKHTQNENTDSKNYDPIESPNKREKEFPINID